MNQGGGLEGLSGGFVRQSCGGEITQLVVDQREQIGSGLAVARCGGINQVCHVGHAVKYRRRAHSNHLKTEVLIQWQRPCFSFGSEGGRSLAGFIVKKPFGLSMKPM